MRVLHLDSARGWRGGQNQVLLTARGMAERGHAVLLGCQAGGALLERARGLGLPAEGLRFAGDFSPLAALALRALVRRFRPDAIQSHDPHTLLAAWWAGGSARRFAVRRVDFPLRGRLSRAKYGACERVIAVSSAIRAVLGASGLPAQRVSVVHEGVPDRPAEPGGRAALRELGVPADGLVVGNVAALTGHKDHASLLDAAALLVAREPRAHLVIAGEGELRPALEARAAALGLGRRCLFLGFRGDLDRLLPAFDVFCLSSRLEGLGTSLLDAMCFARPIVATAAGGIAEAVADGVNGRLVPPGDASALAEALLETLRDDGLRATYGAAGRRLFEERFTDARMVEETLAVLAG